MDETDQKLLTFLQTNGRPTAEDLSKAVNLSPSQAARRRARLESTGVISQYRAVVDPAAIGLTVQAMIQIEMAVHAPDAAGTLSKQLMNIPEIVSLWTMTGDADYLARVYCRDLKELNRLVQEVLLPNPGIAKVRSQIVLDQAKQDAPLPVR